MFEHELNMWLSRVCLCSTCLVHNKYLIAQVCTINSHCNKEDTHHIITFYSFKTCRCTCLPTHMYEVFINHNYIAIIHYVVSYIATYIHTIKFWFNITSSFTLPAGLFKGWFITTCSFSLAASLFYWNKNQYLELFNYNN